MIILGRICICIALVTINSFYLFPFEEILESNKPGIVVAYNPNLGNLIKKKKRHMSPGVQEQPGKHENSFQKIRKNKNHKN